MSDKVSTWDGIAGWAKFTMLCFYCKAAVFGALPTRCFRCGCQLSAPITPKMKLTKLVDLCFRNGKRLLIDAIPATRKGG